MALTSEAVLNGWTVANREGQPPHIMVLDCRTHKQLDVESIARWVEVILGYFYRVHLLLLNMY